MKQETLNITYDLVDEIKSQNNYKRLLVLKEEIDENSEIQDMIFNFNKMNEKYEEVIKYGKYHPDLAKVQKEFSKTKELLYTNPVIKEYKTIEKEIQTQLDVISKEIALAISKKVRYPNEVGLINKH